MYNQQVTRLKGALLLSLLIILLSLISLTGLSLADKASVGTKVKPSLKDCSSKVSKVDNARLTSDPKYYRVIRLLNITGAVYPQISPRFSRGDRRVIFISRLSGEPQVWVKDMRDGSIARVTFFDGGVDYAAWLPDGRLIVAKDVNGNERDQLILISPDFSTLSYISYEPKVIHGIGTYSLDGRYLAYYSNSRDKKYFDVYLYDMRSDTSKLVMKKDGFLVPVEFSPSDHYLVVKEYLSNVETKLYLLDLSTGKYRELNLPPTGRYSYIHWVKGKDGIYLVTDLNSEYSYVAFYSFKDDSLKPIIRRGYNVEQLAVSRDGKLMLVSFNEDGYSKVYLKDMLKGSLKEVELPEGVVYDMEISADGRYALINISRSDYPASVYLLDLKDASLKPELVVSPNMSGFSRDEFVKPKLVHYKSFDGYMVPAFLYLPKDCSEKARRCPAIVYYHGGPEGQARPWFSTTIQLLVSEGFVVLTPNIRGSSGYSRSYLQADNGRNRWVSLKDGYYANLYLSSLPYVDSNRIYAMGGSYGGYMTMAELTFWPSSWAGGIESVGIADMISFLKHTGPWRRKLRISEYGDPVKDRDFLIEVSPYYHADRIKAPLLIVHGKNDPRVPFEQATMMYERLRKLGKQVELLEFEDEGHGISKFENRLKYYLELIRFLEEPYGYR